MKTIGLLGGMSWESTVTYYKAVNEGVKQRLGGLHSAKCVLYSVDFDEIEACQTAGDWAKGAAILGGAARGLEAAGADFLLICTNTMHKVAHEVQAEVGIPLLHIATATAQALRAGGVATVGLLGTKYTMEQDFYRAKLEEAGIGVLVPDEGGRQFVNDVIFNELCRGEINPASKKGYLAEIEKLAAAGAGAVVLGCTEIGLLVNRRDTAVPLYDTAKIHAEAAVRFALEA